MKKKRTQTLLIANFFLVQTCSKGFNSLFSKNGCIHWIVQSTSSPHHLLSVVTDNQYLSLHTQTPHATARARPSNTFLPRYIHRPPLTLSWPQPQSLTFLEASCFLPRSVPQNPRSVPPRLFSPQLLHHFLFQSQLFSLNPSLLYPITCLSLVSSADRAGTCSQMHLNQAQETPQVAHE